jgi:prepilin-type N-terminal cleavage/methylation domain-containing protein
VSTRRRSGDAGVTLVELSVAMFITAVLLGAVATVLLSTLRGVNASMVKISTAADGRLAMEAMSRTLRVAVTPSGETSALVTAKPDEIVFYAMLQHTTAITTPTPTRVRYYRSGNCLMEAQTPGQDQGTTPTSYHWVDSQTVTKCLVRTTQVPTTGSPWFRYTTSGALNGTALIPPTGGLSQADRQSVLAVEVTVTVTDPQNTSAGGVSNDVRVTLDNVALAQDGGQS